MNWIKKNIKPVVAAVVALIVGVGIGASGETPAEPAPAVTVTAEPEAVTETEIVAEVPQVCIEALDEANNLIAMSGEFAGYSAAGMSLASEAIIAAAEWDADTLDALMPQIEEVNTQIGLLADRAELSDYHEKRDACLAEAQQ